MKKKLFILLAAFLLLIVVCLLPGNEPKASEPIEIENHLPTEISADSSKSVIKLVHTMQSNNEIVTKTASAVILHEDDTYYYAVTNYHVLTKEGFETTSVDGYDYLGNHYQVSIILLNQAQEIISRSYDLGLIKFPKETHVYTIPEIRENALLTTTLLTAVGYPDGYKRVTNGYYLSSVKLNEFPYYVVSHTAEILNGNSGGGLFDSSGKLVGINVAAVLDNEGGFVQSYAIPSSKVLEYLELFKL